MANRDCQDARWLVEAVRKDGRGFENDVERQEYQAACDHVRICGCESCTNVVAKIDGVSSTVSLGQA